MREVQFDGIVGPTHNYGALSPGNVASEAHGGETSNPKAAALEGLAKMRLVRGLGVMQAVLPPHERPSLATIGGLGFGSTHTLSGPPLEETIAAAAAADGGHLLRLCSSASAMWAANAATVTPSCDTSDGGVHIVVANLEHMFHRAIEPPQTWEILRRVFGDLRRFEVQTPLPGGGGRLADEGAANHLRLATSTGSAHVFAWGRRAWGAFEGPKRHPARQTREASEALARRHKLDPRRVLFPQQHPEGIDAGAFHTDVLAVGNESFLMLHELAFVDVARFERDLRAILGEELVIIRASSSELPIDRAVASYVFNSQVLTLPGGGMAIVAPVDARDDEHARRFLDRVLASGGPVNSVHYVDVRQSMRNGGGPACLRLRVPLTDEEIGALSGRVMVDDALDAALVAWVERHYRDRLTPGDLADPALAREGMAALEELSSLLGLTVYDFQRKR